VGWWPAHHTAFEFAAVEIHIFDILQPFPRHVLLHGACEVDEHDIGSIPVGLDVFDNAIPNVGCLTTQGDGTVLHGKVLAETRFAYGTNFIPIPMDASIVWLGFYEVDDILLPPISRCDKSEWPRRFQLCGMDVVTIFGAVVQVRTPATLAFFPMDGLWELELLHRPNLLLALNVALEVWRAMLAHLSSDDVIDGEGPENRFQRFQTITWVVIPSETPSLTRDTSLLRRGISITPLRFHRFQ